MKQVIRFTPVFNPTAQTLDFTGFFDGQPFNLSCLMAILNDTRSALIYAAGQLGLGGQLNGNVLTLQYSTFTHSASDVLTILYDANYAPLPIGAATSANQSAIASDGGSMVHITNTPATQNVFVTNEQYLQSITGNVSILNLPVTQNVSLVSSSYTQNVAVTNFPGNQTVSGTVSISAFPTTQNVSLVSSGITQPVSIATMPTTPITGTVSVAAFPTTQNVSLVSSSYTQNVNISSVTGSVPVSGVFYQANQPVSGTVSISAFPTTQNVVVNNVVNVAAANLTQNTVTWNSTTSVGNTIITSTQGMSTVVLTSNVYSGTISAGTVVFETFDGTSWYPIKGTLNGSGYTANTTYSPGTSVAQTQSWTFMVGGWLQFRARLTVAITGTGSLQLITNTNSALPDYITTTGLDPLQAQHPGVLNVNVPQVLAIGGTSQVSSLTNTNTNRVIMTPTADCWVMLGSGTPVAAVPTGTASSGPIFLPASCPSYPIAVTGGTTKIAVIANVSTSAGYLSILESV